MAIPKIRYYCAYQERTHQEVKEKLYSFGLRKTDVEEILAGLIEGNYLNEERFAVMFAGGKFRMKKWGRVKIKHALQQKLVSTYNIKKALQEISIEEYVKIATTLARDKWKSIPGENIYTRQAKVRQYLLQKGYENDIIQQAIRSIDAREE
ncbi:MAG: RecX family transcriptional regulator [Filimonas sp.]|nr:RecX family transcriptional regulator [Filimonas sp.]